LDSTERTLKLKEFIILVLLQKKGENLRDHPCWRRFEDAVNILGPIRAEMRVVERESSNLLTCLEAIERIRVHLKSQSKTIQDATLSALFNREAKHFDNRGILTFLRIMDPTRSDTWSPEEEQTAIDFVLSHWPLLLKLKVPDAELVVQQMKDYMCVF